MKISDRINVFLDRYVPDDERIPTAMQIWQEGKRRLEDGDVVGSNRCERLNYVLHNSFIMSSTKIGENVDFAYGGIGIVVHPSAEIRSGAIIGTNVTIGGKSTATRRTTSNGDRSALPVVEEFAYIATGAKLIGAVTVGCLSIVGANSVVNSDVPALSIVAGAPAKATSTTITAENCLRYKSTFTTLRSMSDEEFVELVRKVQSS